MSGRGRGLICDASMSMNAAAGEVRLLSAIFSCGSARVQHETSVL